MPSRMLSLVMLVCFFCAEATGNKDNIADQPSDEDFVTSWLKSASNTSALIPSEGASIHPLAFDMPYSPDDTGYVPPEMIAAMGESPPSKVDPREEAASKEDLASPRSGSSCSHRRRMFPNHLHVYTMKFDTDDPHGVYNRDAASQNGIYKLITGEKGLKPGDKRGVSDAWGLKRYYHNNAKMVMTYISYTEWGPYQSCNAVHPGQPGSPHHCSTCHPSSHHPICASRDPTLNSSSQGYVRAGRLATYYTGGEWYSFNGDGYRKTWNQYECLSVNVRMTDLIEEFKKVGKCGHCSGSHLYSCSACLRKIPSDERTKVFHRLFHISMDNEAGGEEAVMV